MQEARSRWLLRVRWWLATLFWLLVGVYLCYFVLTSPVFGTPVNPPEITRGGGGARP